MKLLYALLIIFIFSNIIFAEDLNARPNNKRVQSSNARASTNNNNNNNKKVNNANNKNISNNNNNNVNNVNNQINQESDFHLPWFIHTNKQEFELFSSEVLASVQKSINGKNVDQTNNNNNCIRAAFDKLSQSNSNKQVEASNDVPSFNYFIRLLSEYSKKCNIEAATNKLVNSLNYIYSNGIKSFIPYYYNNLSNEQQVVYCFRSAVSYSYDRSLQADKLGQCFASMIMNEKQVSPSSVATQQKVNQIIQEQAAQEQVAQEQAAQQQAAQQQAAQQQAAQQQAEQQQAAQQQAAQQEAAQQQAAQQEAAQQQAAQEQAAQEQAAQQQAAQQQAAQQQAAQQQAAQQQAEQQQAEQQAAQQ